MEPSADMQEDHPREFVAVRCPRCGVFRAHHIYGVPKEPSEPCWIKDAHLRSGYTRELTETGADPPFLDYPSLDFDGCEAYFPKSDTEKERKILKTLDRRTRHLGEQITFDPMTDYPLAYAMNNKEFRALLHHLERQGFIACNATMREFHVVLQPEGRQLVQEPATADPLKDEGKNTMSGKKVFVVHGHDDGTKHSVARFIEKLGLEAIILHEQTSKGRTIIEKFEQQADVAFAVVLLTPDDIGYPKMSPDEARPRARQNVVLELGYFVGKLDRSRVCCLVKGNVEIPTDYMGVVYVNIDEGDSWKLTLAREMRDADLPVDMNSV